MKNKVFAICFTIVSLLNITSLLLLPFKISTASTTKNTGLVQIKVLDYLTLQAIPNATVCIIESGTYYSTNTKGETQKIEVPVIRNTNYDNTLLRNWGDFTILIYKQGYSTHVSFYNEIYSGVTRIGLVCYLNQSTNENQLTTNACVPNAAYLETLIMHYKK